MAGCHPARAGENAAGTPQFRSSHNSMPATHQVATFEAHLRKALPIFAGRHPRVTLEQVPEEADVLISDLRAHDLNGRGAVLQQFLGRRNPERLNVGTRYPTRRRLEAANEVARSHSDAFGKASDRDIAVEMLLQVFLGLSDLFVRMRTRQLHDRISRLPTAWHAEQ